MLLACLQHVPPCSWGVDPAYTRQTGAVLVKDSRAAPSRLDLPALVRYMMLEDSRRCTLGARISMLSARRALHGLDHAKLVEVLYKAESIAYVLRAIA